MAATTGATAANGFIGAGGTAMMATAIPYIAALEALAAWVEQSAACAAAILQAYLTAKAAMIQVPVCETNRVSQAGFVATNVIGQNTPIIIALDMEYYDLFWPNNASNMGGYEGIVTTILTVARHPAATRTADRQPRGNGRAGGGDRRGRRQRRSQRRDVAEPAGVNEAAGAVQPGTAQAAAAPAQSMASMAPQMLSQLGQLPQMLGQFPQMLGQFPQMLGQFPQMAMGMLGPLTSGMNASGLTGAGERGGRVGPDDAGRDHGRRRRGGGGGGAGGRRRRRRGDVQLHRPTGSFNAPGPPKLPTGWAPGAGGGAGGRQRPRIPRRRAAPAALRSAAAAHGTRRTWRGKAPPRAGPCS